MQESSIWIRHSQQWIIKRVVAVAQSGEGGVVLVVGDITATPAVYINEEFSPAVGMHELPPPIHNDG